MGPRRMRTRWTYAEFARLPSFGSSRHEVIEDQLVVTPAPSRRHQRIVTDLVTILNTFVRKLGIGQVFAGPFDVLFGEGDYLEPDIVFVGVDREDLLTDRGMEGPPHLIVEVTSPATAERDRGLKLDRYRHFGVGEYWVVDPEVATVAVWELAEAGAKPSVHERDDVLIWRPAGAPTELRIDIGALLEPAG